MSDAGERNRGRAHAQRRPETGNEVEEVAQQQNGLAEKFVDLTESGLDKFELRNFDWLLLGRVPEIGGHSGARNLDDTRGRLPL